MGSQQSQEIFPPKLSDWSMPDDLPQPSDNSRTPSAHSNPTSLHPDQITSIIIQTPNHPQQQEDDDDYQRHDKYLSSSFSHRFN